MKTSAAMMLARPAASNERGRILLIAITAAVAGGLLIAAASVARVSIDDGGFVFIDDRPTGDAPYLYLTDDGIRPGLLVAVVTLTIPLLAFAAQALRVGSVARDRRMAALRLAGATPRDVRYVAAVETGGAAFAGGLFAGWVYALLWALLGLLPPFDLELLPEPQLLDLGVWAGVAIITGVGGAIAGAALQRRVITEPLGVYRRARPRGPGRWSAVAVISGPVIIVVAAVWMLSSDFLAYVLAIVGVVLMGVGSGPVLVHQLGRRLRERDGAENLLAGWRLEADPRTIGRVAMVLFICGFALGFEVNWVTYWFGGWGAFELTGEDSGAYFLTLGAIVTLAAVVVAVLTMIVGAAEQLLDSRRPLATLVAMGVEERALARVLRRQLTVTAVPAVVCGVVAAGLALGLGDAIINQGTYHAAATALDTAGAAFVAGGIVALAARLANRLLASRLRATVDPENLRVA